MKKFLILILLCSAGMVTHAQDFAGQIGTTRTLANTTADTINFTITKARPSITVKYVITKNSGTVGGTIVLQGKITSLSGEAWTNINSYTLTDATAVNSVLLTSNQYVNYRIITTPTGTQNSTHSKYLLYRGY